MSYLYIVPKWFFGFDIGMEVLFALVAILVAFYAYRIYKLSGQRESRLFANSFLLIAASYIVKAVVNLFILSETNNGTRTLSFQGLTLVGQAGVYLYILLYITGLVTFAYMTFKIDSRRTYTLLLATNLFILIFSVDRGFAFNLMSSLLIFYICGHYFLEFNQKKNYRALVMLVAFGLLVLSGASLILAENYYMGYVLGHVFELGSYLIILGNLFAIIRKSKK